MSLTHFQLTVAAAVALSLTTACGDPTLPAATIPNRIDTLTLAAVRGTPVPDPSGLDIVVRRVSRPDLGQPFDFMFDIDSAGTAMMVPAGLLGLTREAGWRRADQQFEEIITAPVEDYTTDTALIVAVGDVFFARSRSFSAGCEFLGTSLPRYGKFHVVQFDAELRSITLEVVIDVNCGYRGLEPGFPTS
jgi:hypothetical protein